MRKILLAALFGLLPLSAMAQTLNIGTKGSDLSYDQTTMTAHAGKPVTLTFKNNSDPGTDQQHNWVLVQKGKKEDVVALSAAAGSQKSYVPDSSEVLAHTRLLKPGESQTIKFQAPESPGDYPYFCTFPGHSEMLKGNLKVVP
ncbi:MAG: plastocyanin/azurin family copper-binding protein [Bdellovibrionota bacterium]